MLPKQNSKMMSVLGSCRRALPLAILLALIVNSHTSSAQSSGSLSASASGSLGGSNGGLSGQVNADASLSGAASGSAQTQVSGSIAANGGSGPAGGSIISGSENSGGAAGMAGGSASLGTVASPGSAQTYAPSTPKPEGLFSKMKDMVKTSVDSLTKDGNKERQDKQQQEQSASVSMTAGASLGSGESSGQRSTGLIDKLGDAAKKGKEMAKETAKEIKDDVKSMLKPGENGVSSTASVRLDGGGAGGASASADARVKLGGSDKEGPISKLVNKGQEMMHKIENKASEIGHEMAKPVSGGLKADVKIGGAISAKARLGSPKNPENSIAVEMLDKVTEMSKGPVEHAMKPIDQALGYKEDPLVKAIDQTEDLLRKPVSTLAKPVESLVSGAFHTSEEARARQERLMSEQERREMRIREEIARKEGRSVLGQITDKTVDLAEKPFEIILKPVDRVLGFDKRGKKNPLIELVDQIYGFSKRPVDALAKPFENILKKMADGEQAYQVSVRFANSDEDPKLFTRLADGALNIADRIVTRPIEFAMRPFGYDQRKKKNPIVDATHSLKNATKIGFELFTKPIDRIIHEIVEIGNIKDDAEREAEIQRKRQEASRIVAALDKMHEVARQPFEIILRPVGKVLGYNKDGRKKEPLLRAWDYAHQVAMTPIQVLSKPIEDAILGERRHTKFNVRSEVKVGQGKVTAKAAMGATQAGGHAAVSASSGAANERKNFFVESFKKAEKFATKPIDVITSPIRKLILGDDDKIGAGKGFQAKANLGPLHASAKFQTGGRNSVDKQPDKIVKTIEKINNVVLRPIEFITQPISDLVTKDDDKILKNKIDINVKGSNQMRGQERAQASMSTSSAGTKVATSSSASSSSAGSRLTASGSVSARGSGQAQVSGSMARPVGSVSGSASASS